MEFERVEVGAEHHVEVRLSLSCHTGTQVNCLVAIIWGNHLPGALGFPRRICLENVILSQVSSFCGFTFWGSFEVVLSCWQALPWF